MNFNKATKVLFLLFVVVGSTLLIWSYQESSTLTRITGSSPSKSLARISESPRAIVSGAKSNILMAGSNLVVLKNLREAYLYDMQGKVLHLWEVRDLKQKWYSGLLLQNREVVVIDRGHALRKFDANSNEIWNVRGGFHHDVRQASNGQFYTLSQGLALLEKDGVSCPMIENHIVVVSEKGIVQSKIPLHQELIDFLPMHKFQMACDVADQPKGVGTFMIRDAIHSNSVFKLERDIPNIAVKGDWLVSFKLLHLVVIYDHVTYKKKWHVQNLTAHQHDARATKQGTITVFDNESSTGRSRVVEIDPVTKTINWEYDGGTQRFYTEFGGGIEQLPNDNRLISVGAEGKAFELNPAGEVVWQFDLNAENVRKEDRLEFYRLKRYQDFKQ